MTCIARTENQRHERRMTPEYGTGDCSSTSKGGEEEEEEGKREEGGKRRENK